MTQKTQQKVLMFPSKASRVNKRLTPEQREQAKQWREELFAEYAAGTMAPEKKAMVIRVLGPDFFAPVDEFERERREVEAYLKRKAKEKERKSGLRLEK